MRGWAKKPAARLFQGPHPAEIGGVRPLFFCVELIDSFPLRAYNGERFNFFKGKQVGI